MAGKLPFYKIQGCGNDFVVCSRADLPDGFLSSPQAIALICDRHYGVGSDGLMVVGDPNSASIEVLMYNPDGSPMGMCGNGIRCVVRYLFLINPNRSAVSKFNFLVFGRSIICETRNQGISVTVDMGAASFDPKLIPIDSDREFDGGILRLSETALTGWALTMGNPHFVTFVESLDESSVRKLGPQIEKHTFFPERTNVEFVQIVDRKNIKLSVWERAAGLTLACGSGTCAAVVVGIKRGLIDSPCRVELSGGILEVQWDSMQENASVFLEGPAKEVFYGLYSY